MNQILNLKIEMEMAKYRIADGLGWIKVIFVIFAVVEDAKKLKNVPEIRDFSVAYAKSLDIALLLCTSMECQKTNEGRVC